MQRQTVHQALGVYASKFHPFWSCDHTQGISSLPNGLPVLLLLQVPRSRLGLLQSLLEMTRANGSLSHVGKLTMKPGGSY